MSSTPVIDRPKPRRRVRHLLQGDVVTLLVIGLLSFSTLFLAQFALPPRVDRLTVANPSEYAVSVEASGATTGWFPLATIGRGQTRDVESVVDVGDDWIVRFTGQGRDGGTYRYTRAELDANGWVVTVPTEAMDSLRATGAPPTPDF